ncbi:MAG: TonB-dependent receptor [Aureispira sp.]|nr:TonB-dependent receptor [Aureispira sp.]
MQKLILAICFFSINYSSILAQVIRGTVIDQSSNIPIANADVEVLNLSPRKMVSTDETGAFLLEDIPVGRQRLLITYQNYEDLVISELIVAGKEAVITAELSELVEEEITTTTDPSIKTPKDRRRIRDRRMHANNQMATISTRSFTIEEVNRYAGGLNDPGRLVANYAGIFNTDDTQNFIIARGNSPTGVLWRVDGVPMLNPNHFATLGNTGALFAMLNPNTMSNSDFLSGSFAAEYSNATSGIFDIGLRNGNNQKYEFTAQLSLLGAELVAEGPFKKGKSSFLVSYRYSVLSILGALGLPIGTGAAPEYQDLNFKFYIPTQKAGTFTIFGLGRFGRVAVLDEDIDPNDPFAEQGRDLRILTGGGMIGIKNKKFLTPKTYLKTTLSTNYIQYNSTWDSLGLGPSSTDTIAHPYYLSNERTIVPGLSSTINTKFNSQLQLRAGIGAYAYLVKINDHLVSPYLQEYQFDNWLFHTEGFIQLQYKISNRLKLTGGLAGQYFSTGKQAYAIEPRVALNWYPGRRHAFSIGYGWHSKLPSFAFLFYVEPNADNTINNSNLDLGFSRNHHLDISYDLLFAKNWRLQTEIYGQYLTNIPIEQTSSSFSGINYGDFAQFPRITNLTNEGIGYNYGVELTLQKFFSQGFYGTLSGTYFQSKYQGSDGIWRNTVYNVRYITQLVAGKEFKIGKRKRNLITIDLRVNHRGGRPYVPILLEESKIAGQEILDYDRPYEIQAKPYTRVDVKVGARFNGPKNKLSHYFFIDVMNVANLSNELQHIYDPISKTEITSYQLGIIPNIFYQLRF